MVLTLERQKSPLASMAYQLEVLQGCAGDGRFEAALARSDHFPLRAADIEILQINVGKLCNQTCRHCHVDAGPDRREIMTRETAEACLEVVRQHRIRSVDITGGAPEMCPQFPWIVTQARALGCHVIDRCNLTILLAAGYERTAEFLAENAVEIVASLPCYLAENTDAQRGTGVFDKSIQALQQLNRLGYGKPGTGLLLTLVYNPIGPSLPPPQADLETAYRQQLEARFGIVFSRLFTITNMPISRFLDHLLNSGMFDEYMRKLIEAFNPATINGLMCRNTLSVSWDGRLYDCDFNQMLDLGLGAGLPRYIQDFDADALRRRAIVTGQHCYGCTAGTGSGCQGAIATG